MPSFTKKNLLIAAAYALVLGIGIFLGQNFSDEKDQLNNNAIIPLGLTDKTSKLQKAMQLIQQRYVDHVTLDTLEDFALVEILNHLDPHSVYMPARKAAEHSRNLAGRFAGIGAEVYILNDTLFVTRVVSEGPADVAGLKRGDRILWINDKPVANVQITHEKVSDLVRGKAGSLVHLWVKRGEVELVEPLEVERGMISSSTVETAYLLNEETGYIKINQFGQNTSVEFSDALKTLTQRKAKKLIIDLRNNGGGYLMQAINLLEELLPENSLMVYTKGVNDERVEYFSEREGIFEKGKVAILIDENSASASEIVAGAIQDLNRGIVVGRRSYGKGLVQRKFEFGDGSAFNLSVARYYTPSGRSIQKPYKDGSIHYFNELNQRYLTGELTSGQTNTVDTIASDGRIYRSGKGKAMIAEGGIMPDIYINLDTAGVNSLYLTLVDSQVVNTFVYTNMIEKAPSYSLENFMNEYQVSASAFSRLLAFAREKGITFTNREVLECKSLIEKDIKATLARYFFGEDGFLRVKNAEDGVIARANEALKDD